MLVKEITKSSDIQKSKEKSKEKILQAIANNPYITTAELSSIIGISISGIEKNLRQLKERIYNEKNVLNYYHRSVGSRFCTSFYALGLWLYS